MLPKWTISFLALVFVVIVAIFVWRTGPQQLTESTLLENRDFLKISSQIDDTIFAERDKIFDVEYAMFRSKGAPKSWHKYEREIIESAINGTHSPFYSDDISNLWRQINSWVSDNFRSSVILNQKVRSKFLFDFENTEYAEELLLSLFMRSYSDNYISNDNHIKELQTSRRIRRMIGKVEEQFLRTISNELDHEIFSDIFGSRLYLFIEASELVSQDGGTLNEKRAMIERRDRFMYEYFSEDETEIENNSVWKSGRYLIWILDDDIYNRTFGKFENYKPIDYQNWKPEFRFSFSGSGCSVLRRDGIQSHSADELARHDQSCKRKYNAERQRALDRFNDNIEYQYRNVKFRTGYLLDYRYKDSCLASNKSEYDSVAIIIKNTSHYTSYLYDLKTKVIIRTLSFKDISGYWNEQEFELKVCY